MILTDTLNIKWHPKNKDHYERLGYTFTKFGDRFTVSVENVQMNCSTKVDVSCNECSKTQNVPFSRLYKCRGYDEYGFGVKIH